MNTLARACIAGKQDTEKCDKCKSLGTKRKGRPRKSWPDAVEDDVVRLETVNGGINKHIKQIHGHACSLITYVYVCVIK